MTAYTMYQGWTLREVDGLAIDGDTYSLAEIKAALASRPAAPTDAVTDYWEGRSAYRHATGSPHDFSPSAAPTDNTAQCCMCGRKDLSTVEGDGGPECQLPDDRWTCSRECWDKATGEVTDNTALVEAAQAIAEALRHEIGRSRRHLAASTFAALDNWEAVLASRPAAPKADTDVAAENKRLREALEKIAAEEMVRVGYDQTDIGVQPVLTAGEMQLVARRALTDPANNRSAGGNTK